MEKLVTLLDKRRLEVLARQPDIRQKLVEAIIMPAVSRTNPATVLRDAARAHKVDTDAIALKGKGESAAKEQARKA
ncbi:MAG TPA: hypothetical protein VFE22_13895 [Edaphobacter sp.]|nr:hypothetical protein [Edaphobacter sp.]